MYYQKELDIYPYFFQNLFFTQLKKICFKSNLIVANKTGPKLRGESGEYALGTRVEEAPKEDLVSHSIQKQIMKFCHKSHTIR